MPIWCAPAIEAELLSLYTFIGKGQNILRRLSLPEHPEISSVNWQLTHNITQNLRLCPSYLKHQLENRTNEFCTSLW